MKRDCEFNAGGWGQQGQQQAGMQHSAENLSCLQRGSAFEFCFGLTALFHWLEPSIAQALCVDYLTL